MLVVGVCAGPTDRFETTAQPPLGALNVPVLVRRGQTSIFAAYNSIIDEALTHPGFEGLILIHDDVELRDPSILEKVRNSLTTADVVGVIGGSGLTRSMDWYRAEHRYGWATDDRRRRDHGPPPPKGVDAVDGIFLALSPAACRRLRFDESTYHGFHGYDADICAQARSHGMRIDLVEVDLHHHNGGRKTDPYLYELANTTWRLKWQDLRIVERLVLRGRIRLLRWASGSPVGARCARAVACLTRPARRGH